MRYSYTKEKLNDLFFVALEMFDDCLDSDIGQGNLKIEFFNPQNGAEIYERFCAGEFSKYLAELYKEKDYFKEIAAQAFVGESSYGVLIREDIDFSPRDVVQMFLHELSHLYCTANEIPGGNFFDKYCMGDGLEDGVINAGYAIWREAIADIMADSIMSENATVTLTQVKSRVQKLDKEIIYRNPFAKKAMSLLLVYIMISAEVAGTTNWEKAEKEIRHKIGFTEPIVYGLLELVFMKLHRSPFWTITPDFIIELGELYLNLLATRLV